MDGFSNDLFSKLDLEKLDFNGNKAFDPNWINHPLDRLEYHSLYEFFSQGSINIHRCNSLGQLELLTFVEDIEPQVLSDAPLGIQIDEFKENQFRFEINIWSQKDFPLILPFQFDLHDPYQRYELAALCEQNEIPLYFLKNNLDTLIVAFSRSLKFPERVRDRLIDSVLSSYEPDLDDSIQNQTIPASSIPTDDLIQYGWGYLFHLRPYINLSTNNFTNFIYELIHSTSLQFWNNRYKGIQKGPFQFWLSQKDKEQFILYITPFYNLRVSRTKKPFDPIYIHMYQQKGFESAVKGNPILDNAVPLVLYENGELKKIDLDSSFLKTALQFQKMNKNDKDSLYRKLLEDT